jgi:hypothetical protein
MLFIAAPAERHIERIAAISRGAGLLTVGYTEGFAKRGARNEHFLDAALLKQNFLDRLAPYRAQVGYLVFEFPQFHRAAAAGNAAFLEKLDAFLGALPDTFRYAVEVRTESLLGVPLARSLDGLPAGRSFDVVTLHHVLEHIHEPLPFLRDEVAPRVGRLLVVEVPNFSSLASRVHGPRWRDLRPDQHVFHYTPALLSRLLSLAGFRPVRVTTLWEPLWSLRTALNSLRLLPGLARRPRHDAPRPAGGLAGVSDPAEYRRPTGLRLVLTEASRLALWPMIRGLELAGLGERLVVEAEPLPDSSRPVRKSGQKS